MNDSHATDHPTPDDEHGGAYATADPDTNDVHAMAGHPMADAGTDGAPAAADAGTSGAHAPASPAATDQADHGGEHGHATELLGPIDWSAWGAGVAGVILGLAVVGCFVLATSALPGA